METEQKRMLHIWTRDQKSFLTYKLVTKYGKISIIEIRSKFPLGGNWRVLFHGALQHLFLAARRAHKFAAQRWLHSVRAAKSLWETSGGSSSEGAMFKRINGVDAGDSEKRFLSAFYQSALNKFWVSSHGLDLVFCCPVTRRRQRAASGINH
jgi:hypothetical protein